MSVSQHALLDFSTFKSEPPLLILKEASDVMHNEINSKRKAFPPFLPLKPTVPPFSPHYTDVPRRGRERARKRAMEEITVNEKRAEGDEKYRQETKYKSSPPLLHLPLTLIEEVWSIIVLMDDWAFTG